MNKLTVTDSDIKFADENMYKKCTKCKKTIKFKYFYNLVKGRYSKSSMCKPCSTEYHTRYSNDDDDVVKIKNKIVQLKQTIKKKKKGNAKVTKKVTKVIKKKKSE